MKKICLARPSKENMSQVHDLANFWCDLGDSGTFWSDFNEFKMQNHSVIKRFVEFVNV